MAETKDKKKRKPVPPVYTSSANGDSYDLFARGKRDLTDYSAQTVTNNAAAGGGLAGLDPRTFSDVAPIERPGVAPLEEEVPQRNVDNSLLGGFLNVMDNIVPDDMGGMIRGESGWMSDIPGYRETVGATLAVPLTMGSAAIDAINWGSEQMNHLGAALFSALPGGIQTLDWEQSQQISMGQVVSANAAINNRGGATGWLINVATLQTPFAAAMKVGENQQPDNILYSDEFNILDPEIRKEAFESGGMGQITSGFADAVWLVAADPLILLGGASTVARLGTKASKFGGYSNQPLKSVVQIDRFGENTLEQGRLIQELGVEGARSSRRLTSEGENLIAAMENKAEGLYNHPWVRNSSDKRTAQALLAETSLDRAEEAASLAGAMAGHPGSWARLRELNADLYEATAMSLGVNPLAPVGSTLDDFATAGIKLTDEQIQLADDIIYERLADRIDLVDEIASAGQILQRGGARKGPRTVRAANAWRAGASKQALENNPFKRAPKVEGAKSGHFTYDIVEGIAGSMPLRVVRWVGQGNPTGIVFLKDGPDAMGSLDEFGAWLRKSPMEQEMSSGFFNEFSRARTVGERKAILVRAEDEMINIIAANSKGRISPEAARAAYAGYNSRRAALLESAHKTENNFFIDPTTNEIVKTPGFYAELDQSFPLLDVKEFTRVVADNPAFKYIQEGLTGADYLNSLWKVSVLARLGYTQRNIAEGALRAFAVLGVMGANPKAWGTLYPSNLKYYSKVRRGSKKARAKEKSLLDARYNLEETRKMIQELNKADFDDAGKLDALIAQIDDLGAKESRLVSEVDRIAADLQKTIDQVRFAQSKRKLVGRRENVMYDGQTMRGAFQDSDGAIALKVSSADNTTYMTFDGVVAARYDKLANSPDFRRIDPEKLTAAQLPAYFDEYAIRLNFRYRNDPVGKMILADRPMDEIVGFLMSPLGVKYRKQMSVYGRQLRSEDEVRGFVSEQIRRLDNEVPADTGLRAKLLQGEVSSAEIAAEMGSRKLPAIVGRIEDGMPPAKNTLQKGKDGLDAFTGKIMRYLGTVPEDKMLRHPFYNTVYMQEQSRLYRIAAERGVDMSSNIVKGRINSAAHKIALKSTRQTMYTIDRFSNAAVMLRFISPFFPAFENAIRTWGRIIWANPAVVGAGNILWNIPNNLGWVVNEKGEKVGEDGKPLRSSFLRDDGNYIVWPEMIQNVFKAELGPFTPGEAIRTRQSGMNVIFPGSNFWFPGVGPMTSIPTAWFLRGKPEDAEILKQALGDELFREIVPMGQVQGDFIDSLLPTVARRFKQMWQGESSDSAYITLWNQVIEDEYISAQLDGRRLTDADMERIKQKAERFWTWQIGAAAAAPAQSTINSPWQLQRDMWNKLIDDTTLPYAEKIKRFKGMFDELEPDNPLFGKGDAFMSITRSGTYRETKLSPNLTTWARITKHKDIVDDLYRVDPELVGMFGNMGSFDDPFSYAVYGEYTSATIGPNGAKISRKLKPSEINRNNEVADGWVEYRKVKDMIDEKVIQLGYSSLQVNDAEPLRKVLDDAVEVLADRYPAWDIERKQYEDKLPAFIYGARKIVENGDLMEEDSTVRALSDYLEIRDAISDKLSEVKDRDTRNRIKQVGYAAAFTLRQQDIGFADFYDQYLSRDDFRSL